MRITGISKVVCSFVATLVLAVTAIGQAPQRARNVNQLAALSRRTSVDLAPIQPWEP